MVKLVFVGTESTVGKGENTCINRMSSFSNNIFKAYLSNSLRFCVPEGFQVQTYKIVFAKVTNKTKDSSKLLAFGDDRLNTLKIVEIVAEKSRKYGEKKRKYW